MSRPRAIFFGTPAFAVPCLASLLEVAEVVAVVSQPDRRSGRGMKERPPPVKELALREGVPHILQPTKVRTAAFAETLRGFEADVSVVVAYGRILPLRVLNAARLGALNVHASLLPKLRGAAPIQWSIVRGHRETGVCLMQMDEGMDTGPVLAVRRTPIGPEETAGELAERLSGLGGVIIRDELPRFLAGELTAEAQDHSAATMAPLLSKSDGRIDWRAPASDVHNRVRGLAPWPGAFAEVPEGRVKVHRVAVAEGRSDRPPGTVLRADRHGVEIGCGQGTILSLLELQASGSRRMAAGDYIAGHPLQVGTSLEGTTPEDTE
ncbi:MAG: methionyl-tRNA formyltransferase [Myxococcota bacterium]